MKTKTKTKPRVMVTDCWGRKRQAVVVTVTFVTCPFCGCSDTVAPALAGTTHCSNPGCSNPGCDAALHVTTEIAMDRAYAEARREDQARERDYAYRAQAAALAIRDKAVDRG